MGRAEQSMNNRKRIIPPILLLSVVTFLLVLSCQTAVVRQDNRVGTHTGSIIWDGLERTYRIHIPQSFDETKPVPLIIALHGGGGTGEGMEKLTLGGFNTLSHKEGFIVVYPDGIEKHWNDGRELRFYRTMRENIDDVGFISALIEHLAQSLNIDRSRVYATGISNGGLMSQRLACELSDKIAAIAIVAVQMSDKISLMGAPTRPIAVLMMCGTEDPLVPWEGGDIGFDFSRPPRKYGKVLSVAETVKYWVAHNQCSPMPVVTQELDKDPQDGTQVRREVYDQGREETEVILYAIEGGGHTWPRGWQYLPEGIIGKTSRDIDANEVIWNFFNKHAIK